jgi:chromosome segregation ATPase
MKKWMYVLGPGIMLAVFLFFYLTSKAETDRKLAADKIHNAEVQKEADEKKAIAEKKAQEDAERRNVERAEAEKKAAQDKQDKYDADMARIKADTDRYNALVDANAKQVSELSIELDSLHKQKDSLTREGFELAKRVELAEVSRRNAELEIQRMTTMISNRADQSMMTKMPPPPPKES